MNRHARFTAALWTCLALAASASPSLASPDADPAQAHAGGSATGSITDVSASPPTPVLKPQSRPDFSGHWALDAKASDDPQERIKQAMKQARSGGQGMRGGGMGGGGMGGKRQGRGSQEGMGERSEMPFDDRAALVATAKTLDITHEDPMLLIADENDRHQRLFTDFRGVSVSASGGGQPQAAVAGWEGDALVVESRMNHGSRLVQQYRIDAGTGQLMISSAVELPNLQEATFYLVYDRLKPGTDAGNR
ncbi:MAG: hypothetical protein ACYC2D_10595 [Thiobacillus sp.]